MLVVSGLACQRGATAGEELHAAGTGEGHVAEQAQPL